jgi:hypothetical protein
MADETSKIIYHYCSLEAFYSIITKKSFWLFSLSSTDDIKEMEEAETTLNKILSEEKYKSIIKPNTNKSDEFYSLSCTSEKDDALLFYKYADHNEGVCFGIDTKVFKKYLSKSSPKNLYIGYLFFPKVFYSEKGKEKEIRKYLDERLFYIDQVKETKVKELYELLVAPSSEHNKEILRELAYITALSRFKPKMKIASYKNEHEVRMLFCKSLFQSCKDLFSKDKTSPNSVYSTWIKLAEELKLNILPEYKVTSDTKRECIELKMESIWDEHPIKKVILGPNCNTKIEEFNEFLKENGMSCKAVKSNIENRQ